jgi:hypothetical protein
VFSASQFIPGRTSLDRRSDVVARFSGVDLVELRLRPSKLVDFSSRGLDDNDVFIDATVDDVQSTEVVVLHRRAPQTRSRSKQFDNAKLK